MEAIVPQPGSERDPRHFVGRRATTGRARERLGAGANLLLSDPRRMGKTFWMRTFAAREQDFRCYHVDYEGVATMPDFLIRTAQTLAHRQSLPDKVKCVLRTIFDHVDAVSAATLSVKVIHRQTSPHRLLTDVLAALDTPDDARVPVVLMDEVPMAVDNIAQRDPRAADELLQTLRALRQGASRVRWVVAGSIGFHHVLRRAGATPAHLGDLEPLPLGPLPDNEARELAHRLLLGIRHQPTDDLVSALVEVAGGVPFLQHKVASALGQQMGPVGPVEVRDCFEDLIDDPDEARWFDHYLTRVGSFYGGHRELANQVLDTVVTTSHDWVSIDRLPDRQETLMIVDDLVRDHYLEARGRSLRWRYPALQYLWARRRRLWDRPLSAHGSSQPREGQ